MRIVVPIKLVPDLVEELEIDASGTHLDTSFMRLIINELDEHAVEEALLLKERSSGEVIIIAPDYDGADDVLFTAAAKNADRLIKLTGDLGEGIDNHQLAHAYHKVLRELQPDLVLTGVQAHDDIDGSLGPLLAEQLGMPYVGYISGIAVSGTECTVKKEYPGGLIAEMEVRLPAVLGIQAAEEPPRYVAVSRVRQAMKTATIDEQAPDFASDGSHLTVTRMFQPESGERATMIVGHEDEVADRLIEIFREVGVI